MHCQQFESRLQALLDSRNDIDTDQAVCRHMEGCPDCRALAGAYSALAGARLPMRSDLIDGLADRVLNELNTPVAELAKPRVATTPAWTRVAIALAASVLVVVSVVRLREATAPVAPLTHSPTPGTLAGDPRATMKSIPVGDVFYRTGQGLASISLPAMRSNSTQTETPTENDQRQSSPLFDTFRNWFPAGSESSSPAQGETGWIHQLDVTLVA